MALSRRRLEGQPGDTEPRPFTPSAPQLRYLRIWLDPNSPNQINALADAAKVPRRTVYGWFEDPEFCRWFNDNVQAVFVQSRHRMWRNTIELAIAGSPEHIKLVALRFGELRPEEGTRAGALQVFLNVPRPPQRLEATPDTILDVTPVLLPVTPSHEEQ